MGRTVDAKTLTTKKVKKRQNKNIRGNGLAPSNTDIEHNKVLIEKVRQKYPDNTYVLDRGIVCILSGGELKSVCVHGSPNSQCCNITFGSSPGYLPRIGKEELAYLENVVEELNQAKDGYNYELDPVTSYLVRKKIDGAGERRYICLHLKKIALCCGTKETPVAAKNTREVMLKKEKVEVGGRLMTVTSIKQVKESRKKTMSTYNLSKQKGGKSTAELKLEERRLKRKAELGRLLDEGYVDGRGANTKCRTCKKIKVPYENVEYVLKANETFAYFNKKRKLISWALCVPCCAAKTAEEYENGGNKFHSQQVNGLRYHLTGTADDRWSLYQKILDMSSGNCASCGIEVIAKGKAGWRQFSINYKHPDRKSTGDSELSDLLVTCLACNLFQNDMSWTDSRRALCMIAESEGVAELPQQPIGAITKEEMAFFVGSFQRVSSCPLDVKLQVVEKYGRKCVYTGVPLVFKSGDPFTISFDRQDSKQPYTVEQTRPVSKHINYVKIGKITEEHLLEWLQQLRNNKKLLHENFDNALVEEIFRDLDEDELL